MSRASFFAVLFCLGCYASREATPDALHPDAGVDFDADVDADSARDADVDTGRYVPPPDPVIEDPPPPPTGEPLRAVEVVLTDSHACALDDAGRVWCWGMFPPAEIRRSPRTYPTPVPVQIGPLPALTTIGLIGGTVCGIDRASQTWCWGFAEFRSRGATYDMRPLPEPELSPADALPSVCAVSAGRLRCHPFSIVAPEELGDLEGVTDFVEYTIGDGGGCVLSTVGVRCAGDEVSGLAGDGDRNDGAPLFPARVVDLGYLDSRAFCALDVEGELRCWGPLRPQQLGLEATSPPCFEGALVNCADVPTGPLPVPRLQALSRGQALCGLTTDHEVWCWLGPDDACEDVRTCLEGPTRIEIEPVATLSASDSGVCAVTRSGGIRCFALANTILRGDGSPEQRVEDRGTQPTSWVSGFVQD
ncbi:MAG: hypothetical protein H6721_15145 [Sandaracinus sp.]|nr:hypothetical protein [Sandaracinus sp.]MCB9633450.1 hypothetical protein [Sandaracinus sp.]